MRLAGQPVTVVVTEEGRSVLELARIELPDTHLLSVLIEESEDLGLWLRFPRRDRMHLFLLRWEYILGIDLPAGVAKIAGLKG